LGKQLDLFDNGIDEAYVIAKSLYNHKIKIYKKCGKLDCKEEILNKPSRHFCWMHIIDLVSIHTPLFPFHAQAPLVCSY